MNEQEDDQERLGRVVFEPAVGITLDQARVVREGMQHREQSALAMYRAWRDSDDLGARRVVSYRCRAEGCLLLDVFSTPVGSAVYKPAFRFSPNRNDATHPQARATRTSDGDRRWVETADLLDSDPPAGLGVEYWTQCDHVLDHPLPAERVVSDCATRRGEVIFLP